MNKCKIRYSSNMLFYFIKLIVRLILEKLQSENVILLRIQAILQ